MQGRGVPALHCPRDDMKFTKPFTGVPNGSVYPIEYRAGAECPRELEAAARCAGALGPAVKRNASKKPNDAAAHDR